MADAVQRGSANRQRVVTEMMQKLLIAGDWGSTHMRLHLFSWGITDLQIVASVQGAGIKDLSDPETAFFDACHDWFAEHSDLPVFLAGMVGSNIGWRDVGYRQCPLSLVELSRALETFVARGVTITIVPGLNCENIFGLPDIMRGEEVQLLGWLQSVASDAESSRIVCLPGTHAKWVRTSGDRIIDFFTSMTGEMHHVLMRNSILGRGLAESARAETIEPDREFIRGAELMMSNPALSVEHAVFSVRSRSVLGQLAPENVRGYLSGVLVAAAVRDALAAYHVHGIQKSRVTLIGTPALMYRYSAVLQLAGVGCDQMDAQAASLSGLGFLARKSAPNNR